MLRYTQLKEHCRQDLKEVLPLAKPFTLIIEPTSICNFRCVQCFQSISEESYFTQNRAHMSMEAFGKVIDDMKKWPGPRLKVLKLSLYGEPLLNEHFCEMLKLARQADIAERIETTTNASLLDEATCSRLVAYGLDYMRVSVYSAIQERHEDITGSKIKIEAIHSALRMLQDAKRAAASETPFVSVKMLDAYSSENDTFLGMYKDVADEVYLDKPHSWIAYKDKDFIGELYKEEGARVKNDLSACRSSRVACTLPFFTLAVRSNGDVSPCCIDWLGATNIGNIRKSSLRELWDSGAMYEFRKMQLENRRKENKSCRNCEFCSSDYYVKDNVDGFPVERLKTKQTGASC